MAKAPRSSTGAKNRHDEDAALTLLDAAFCVDAKQRCELVRKALASNAQLQHWAERWALDNVDEVNASGTDANTVAHTVANTDTNIDVRVAESLPEFFLSLSAPPTGKKGSARDRPLSGAWRKRLASLAHQFAPLDASPQPFDDALAAAKVDAIKEFAYGAGHEINNPLANISARAQTLLRDETNAERRRALATINRQAMRAHEMIADLMLFARPPRLSMAQFDATVVVRRVVEELSTVAAAQATRLTCRVGETPLLAVADETQFGVAVKAVVRNAIEAVAAGGNVDVDARIVSAAELRSLGATKKISGEFRRELGVQFPTQGGSRVRSPADVERPDEQLIEVSVSDDGPGFSPREQAHLFDPFFSGREAGRGLGFGLCVAWRIVTDHSGQIAVISEPGRGATIVLTLPAGKTGDSSAAVLDPARGERKQG